MVDSENVRPLLKWPGGKRKIARAITIHFPKQFKTYYEPFFGGGALFFSLAPRRSVLSDVNRQLIETYIEVRDNAERVLSALSHLRNDEESYYQIRAKKAQTKHTAAARLIYLCTYSFNGIYRENLRGEYNVPYGHKTSHPKPTALEMHAVSARLQNSEIRTDDFEHATEAATTGDLVYFDPPYTLKSENGGFRKYNASLFSWSDQERLARVAAKLVDRGASVYISNASHSEIRKLYPRFKEVEISRPSVIAASAAKRSVVTESLFIGHRE